MLNDLQTTVSEAIIFENLKQTAEKLEYLEQLDKNHWVTTACLCKKIESKTKHSELGKGKGINQSNKRTFNYNSNLAKGVSYNYLETNIVLSAQEKNCISLKPRFTSNLIL